MTVMPDLFDKVFMDPGVLCHFRMKSKSDLIFILHTDNVLIYSCQYLNLRGYFCNVRRPDKNERKIFDIADIGADREAAQLSAIGISLYGYRQGGKVLYRIIFQLLCKEDQSCTGG